MTFPSDAYRVELIDDLLFASSQDEVKGIIAVVARNLEEHNVNEEVISLFMGTIINDLELFNPMKKEAQQWSNIQLAKILFKRMRARLIAPAV